VCDDRRNTVLMMSPSISHYHSEGAVEEMRKLQGAYTVEMASLDDEVGVSCVGGEGRISGMASKVCMDKGMCKSWTAG